jgi:hypothetical protein
VPAIAFNAALLVGRRKKLSVLLVFILLVFLYYLFGIFFPNWYGVVSVPEDNFIKNCRVASDKWVFFYSHGIVAECSYDIGDWNKFVASGGNFVLYDYKNLDLNGYNLINRGDYVIVKSDYCAKQPKKYISGSLRNYVIKWLKDTNSTFYDYSDWVE